MMHFLRGLHYCTYCKIRAVSNFEVGREMKKNQWHSAFSQSTRYYFQTWFIWQNTDITPFVFHLEQIRNHLH